MVDGVICDTWVEKFKGKIKRDIVMTSSAVYTSETTMRPYVFAKVEHTGMHGAPPHSLRCTEHVLTCHR